jgi:nitrogen regulatory protein PII
MEIRIVVDEDAVDGVVQVIMRAARTGQSGDGRVRDAGESSLRHCHRASRAS